jgi:hypothetical protein
MLNLDYPVLEVFQYVLAKGSTSSDNAEAMRLATKHWKAEGYPVLLAPHIARCKRKELCNGHTLAKQG